MSLEHRWSKRKQVCLDAVVLHRPQGLSRVKILDIGLGGAFIHGERLKLPAPTMLELTFVLDNTGRQDIHHVEAMVIHATRRGYGLMFKGFRLQAYRTLRNMLYAA